MWNEDAHISGLINPFFIWFYFLGSGRDVALASPRSTMLMASTPGRNERNNNDRPSVRPFIRPAIQSGPSSHGRQPWEMHRQQQAPGPALQKREGKQTNNSPIRRYTWIFLQTFRDSRTNASPLFSCTTDTCDRNVPSKKSSPCHYDWSWLLLNWIFNENLYVRIRIEYQRNIWCSRFSPERE
jgi:hypothetical protein